MDLDVRNWYVRWFFWSHGIWDAFHERDTVWRINKQGTNLCYFMRVTLIWAPLVLLLHAIVYGAAIAALTYFPVHFIGGSRYLWGVAGIAFLIGIIFAIKTLRQRAREREWERGYNSYVPQREVEQVQEEEPKAPGFWQVFLAWVVAQKKKVCPTITFGRRKEDRQ